jgi:hypothetical protein
LSGRRLLNLITFTLNTLLPKSVNIMWSCIYNAIDSLCSCIGIPLGFCCWCIISIQCFFWYIFLGTLRATKLVLKDVGMSLEKIWRVGRTFWLVYPALYSVAHNLSLTKLFLSTWLVIIYGHVGFLDFHTNATPTELSPM